MTFKPFPQFPYPKTISLVPPIWNPAAVPCTAALCCALLKLVHLCCRVLFETELATGRAGQVGLGRCFCIHQNGPSRAGPRGPIRDWQYDRNTFTLQNVYSKFAIPSIFNSQIFYSRI